jgi:uncharacterized membrane protein YeaQ/YmgE (transglycosylase-associated protein family)
MPHDLIWVLVIGVVTGWLAGKLVTGKGLGLIADMVIGILGAFLGDKLAGFLHVNVNGFWESFGMSVVGAVVLLVVIRVIKSN